MGNGLASWEYVFQSQHVENMQLLLAPTLLATTRVRTICHSPRKTVTPLPLASGGVNVKKGMYFLKTENRA